MVFIMNEYGKKALELFLLNDLKKLNPTKTSKKYIQAHYQENIDTFTYLDNVFDDLFFPNDLMEILYRIKMNLNSNPKCPICGKNVKFQNFQKGYTKTCSDSCKTKLEHIDKINSGFYDKRKNNVLKIRRPELFYDWSIISEQNDDWILKHFLRKRKRICPDTNKLETGTWTKNELNKPIINYIKKRFTNSTDIEENLYWLYNNLNERPVCPVCGGSLKFINFVNGYQRVCSHSCATLHKDTRKKLIETNNKRYGSNFYLGTKECLEKTAITLKERYKDNYYNNPKSEVTSHSSKGEKKLFEILKELYPETVQYYRDKRYANPRNNYCWECDFYIKSLDLFIEYQGFRSHGGHPYDKNNQDDINTVMLLKERIESDDTKESTKKFLQNIITVWTKNDVFKRFIAHKNNLNYLEIYETFDKLNKNFVIQKINNVISS